jgi:hypothetical protein
MFISLCLGRHALRHRLSLQVAMGSEGEDRAYMSWGTTRTALGVPILAVELTS